MSSSQAAVRPARRRATLLALAGLVGGVIPFLPPATAVARAAGSSPYTFTDLGVEVYPAAINNDDYIVEGVTSSPPGVGTYVVHNGARTRMGAFTTDYDDTAQNEVYDINDAGQIVGQSSYGQAMVSNPPVNYYHAAMWDESSPGSAPKDLGHVGTDNRAQSTATYVAADGTTEAFGTAEAAAGSNGGYTIGPFQVLHGTGAPTPVGPAPTGLYQTFTCGVSDDGHILFGGQAGGASLLASPSDSGVPLDLTPGCYSGQGFGHPISGNGTIVGNRGGQSWVRSADGTEVALPSALSHDAAPSVNDSGVVVGGSAASGNNESVVESASGSAPVLSFLPSGWKGARATDLNDEGDIVGTATGGDGKLHGFFLKDNQTRLTASIAVTAADGSPLTGTATEVGKTLKATVTLSNTSGSPTFADTALTVDAHGLSVDAAKLQYVSGPSPAPPTRLAAGASVGYASTFRVLGRGHTTVSVTANATENGKAVTTTGTLELRLGQPLQASITWRQGGQPLVLRAAGAANRPDTLKLADADDGEVPQDVQAVLTVTNVSTVTQEHITINGRPVPSFHDAAHALPSVPLSVIDGPPTNTPIPAGASGTTSGTLAPGASASLTYTVHVRDNGVFDLSAQLLSSDVGGTSTNVSSGLGTLTVVPTALLWLQLKRVDNAPVRAGLPVEIRGTLTNRSQTQTVNAAPLEPVATTGNAGGGRLVDDTSPANLALSYLADGVQLPFLGPVKPGQKITLKGVIDTTYVPSTLATLTYEPAGQVVNTDGTTTDLTVSQVGTATGTTPIKITIDARDPDVPPADVQTEIQNFENSVAQGTGAWAEGNFRAALGFLQHPVDSGVAGVSGVAKAILHSPRDVASAASILASVSYYNAVYLALTPQQRANFERSILDDFDASTVKGDNAELSKAVHAGFGAFADALAHQDYNKVASLAGSGVATSGGLVVDTLLSDIFFQKLALGVRAAPGASRNFVRGSLTDALVLADEVRNAKLSKTIIKTTDGITAGQNLLVNHASALINAWGLTPAQITGLINFCKDNQIILAVRSRSKRAADLIRRGLAIGKNEILKLKAVNPIDVEWLGYRQADLNKLTNAEPISRSQLIDELLRRHASPQLKEIVLERWQLRHDEWFSPKVRGVMQAADAKGQIEWGFNGTDNGAPAADRTALRKFQLRTLGHVEMPYGPRKPRIYQQVLVGNKPGRIGALVGVTQDVDIAAILEKTNTISSALKRTKFYEYLSDVIGIEHPETVSWINKGEILFAAKYKELSRLFYGGGEVLAVFGPDGIVRAGFINPALTIYNATTKGGLIIFDGGYNNIYSKAASKIVVNLKNFF